MNIIDNPLGLVVQFRRSAPVNVEGLALALGVPVIRANMLPEDSGELEKVGDKKYVIRVNENHSILRQRFTIAHEIGHYILHRHKIGDGVSDNKLYRSNPSGRLKNLNIGSNEETEANQFAVNVLMPYDLVMQLMKEGYSTPEQLSQKLEVSVQAIKIRLHNILAKK